MEQNIYTNEQDIPTDILKSMYRSMLLIRESEETLASLLETKEVHCPVHLCTGQEAIHAGVCTNLNKDDYIFGGHRSHGHYLAKGGCVRGMMAEIFGKKTGCSGGKGGSMHLFAKEVGVLGTVPIVAASIPIATGTALASTLKKDGRISVSFFGDGATDEGTFHESMNLAAQKKLPVIFVCENNFYASHMHILERRSKDNIYVSAEFHGMPSKQIDGNNAVEVFLAMAEAANRARNGEGPTFLECRTFRWRGHVGPAMDTDVGVKRKEDITKWIEKDPIPLLKKSLLSRDISEEEISEVENTIKKEIEEALTFAKESPFPDKEELFNHVYWTNTEG